MLKKILIDCNKEDNYRIAIVDGQGQLEECNFQSEWSIKSNVYLAKVIRVEPSLQAAFVEYLDGKIGFLPFSEIHPDYYHIPIKDKEELKALIHDDNKKQMHESEKNENNLLNQKGENDDIADNSNDDDANSSRYYYMMYKKYNIQEVIKKGQNVLVQVFKDGRGNKGASLTTYIVLPGRYCVLMPNSPRGIGISKKIASYEDRRRILHIVKKFQIPYGTGLVIRTAGVNANETDLQADYRYLIQLWNDIRSKAINSSVHSLIYEESNVILQTIRDNYNANEINSIVISGKKGYEEVKKFIKDLMPKEEHKLKFYNDRVNIFKKYGVDNKLQDLLSERVDLKGGGYLVINQTEALTAIDVNSGKSIQEKNIEETAVKTNVEAAQEIAKQLRLRNIGGLIVVDFIDMMELRNKKTVEQELRKVFLNDKAKVQFTRISMFGLVEISRQRMRSSIAEILTIKCPQCEGVGHVKSLNIVANDIYHTLIEKIEDPKSPKKTAIEILCSDSIIESLAMIYNKEIEEIQKKHQIKICFSKYHFDKREDFIIRAIQEVGDLKTITDIHNSVLNKLANKRKENLIKKAIKRIVNLRLRRK